MVGHEIDIAIPYTYKIGHWKDHFKSDLGSDQDQIKNKMILIFKKKFSLCTVCAVSISLSPFSQKKFGQIFP
jgi:hypothetical protein